MLGTAHSVWEVLMRVLVVEDEEVMADAVARGLRRSGFGVDTAADGIRGHELASINYYDVILLDRDLPGMHGDDVCRRLVAEGCSARIMMLTAAGLVPDRVEGLNLGADDYLAKPFAFDELLARVTALARRAGQIHAPTLRAGDLEVDVPRREVTLRGQRVELTLKEFGILQILAENAGRYVSAEELLERVWDENADPFTNTVRVTLVGLRKKLGHELIETRRGVGYRLQAEGAPGSS
jgi:DNA-binding response OmpR family regulator